VADSGALPNDGRGSVITVGTFDGVHLGHRRVIEEIASRARRSSCRSMLVTFEPHPMQVVNPQAAPPLLTVADERREFLAQSELDVVVFMEFTRQLSQFAPEAFVHLLLDRFHMRELVIGHDHGFGQGRAGNVELLERLGRELGFGVDVVDVVDIDHHPVSSTLVRRAVAGGDLDTARRLLGRPYSLTAPVVRGATRGRRLGFPTVNVRLPDQRKLLPPDGVYAVWAEWADGASGGMMHQGPRPTFGDEARSIEAHLFDLDRDLYGKAVKLSWVARLRDVQRFSSSSALARQLNQDVAGAESALTRWRSLSSH
jgi:riboflavin kinase/FMN adenylyltransferase